MFDPEKVDILTAAVICSSYGDRAVFVKAKDYDQLLKLYRAAAGPNAINAYRICEGLGIDGK